MSLPNKGTRPIDISGSKCRWVLSENDSLPYAKLIVQGFGGALTVRVTREVDGFYWLWDEPGNSSVGPMTPSWVKEISMMAKKNGWDPEGGESFEFQLENRGLISCS
ncbi:hypothetical protein [Microbulbifer guangxiensis]|uniref:hypothetical protein n=1 Tax=Microbulbifer guangxiensis TaxID=2904249 RepID=UPI001F393157|nr:hypothetical protein [Microbulbifer guangxiensis]